MRAQANLDYGALIRVRIVDAHDRVVETGGDELVERRVVEREEDLARALQRARLLAHEYVPELDGVIP